MTKEVKIPQISEGSNAATVGDIYVSEGDTVEKDQELIAVDSDKASVDIPNEEGKGKVKEIKVSKGDEVEVGDVILILEIEDEGDSEEEDQPQEKEASKEKDADSDADEDEEDAPKEEEDEDDEDEKQKPAAKNDQQEDKQADKQADRAASVPAAPLAKKFARELGIDLKKLSTDDKKRITRDDVMEYAKKVIASGGSISSKRAEGGKGVEPIELPDFSQWGETESQPLSGIRTAVAKNTVKSWQNIPHVTQHDEADLTELQVFREDWAARSDEKLSLTALITKICTVALQKFPRFNASLDMANRELILKKYYNIGIAADTDEGLLMPVLKNTDQKSLREINSELKELALKARSRKLKPDEMKGGNFTISNLGGIGGTSFTPVIFPPQVAILGVSASEIKPRWIEDEFVPSEMVTFSLSYDHRVIDGADAARFLRWICDVVEEPFHLL